MNGLHPEISAYFEKVMHSAFETYLSYLREFGARRVHLQPHGPTNRSEIEIRIEAILRALLLNNVPSEVREQIMYEKGLHEYPGFV